METIYDWASVAVFGVLVVLFLHRSAKEQEPTDTIYHYIPPAIGCAVANYLGNHDLGPASIVLLVAVLIYIVLVLKPFGGIKL